MLRLLGGAEKLRSCAVMAAAVVSSISFSIGSSSAQGEFPEGAKNLFIGHSYFGRVAEKFEELVNEVDFPENRYQAVYGGGPNGSVQALYLHPSRRADIEQILDQGDIELFWMTVHPTQDPGTEYYEIWIDYALAQNPETKIVITFPRVQGGPSMELEDFQQANDLEHENTFNTIIAPLRRKYAERTDIFYIDYSEVMDQLWEQFDAGNLPVLSYFNAQEECIRRAEEEGSPDPEAGCETYAQLVDLGYESLFRDTGGHAGAMGTHTAAMVWFYFLYEDVDYYRFIDPQFGADDVLAAGRATVRQNFYAFQPESW